MPKQKLEGCVHTAYVVHFDKHGFEEREEDEDSYFFLSDKIATRLASDPPVTDVVFVAHGFKTLPIKAYSRFDAWVSAMAKRRAEKDMMSAARGHAFIPLVVGIHWPSSNLRRTEKAFKDAKKSKWKAAKGLTKAFGMAAIRTVDAVVDGVVSGAEALEELDGKDDVSFTQGMMQVGTAATQATQWHLFERIWDRSKEVGQRGVHDLLRKLQAVATHVEAGPNRRPDTPIYFHAFGHSLGCNVVASAVEGPGDGPGLARPIHSLVLVQGAMPTDCFMPTGIYPTALRRVAGVTLITKSATDSALRWYAVHNGPAIGLVGVDEGSRGRNQERPRHVVLRIDAPLSMEDRMAYCPGQVISVEATSVMSHHDLSVHQFCSVGTHDRFLCNEVIDAAWLAMAMQLDAPVAGATAPQAEIA